MDAPLIEIKVDEKKLDNIRRMLAGAPNAMPTAISRGINRTAASARAELVRRLRERLNLKIKRVRQYVMKPTRATRSHWQSTIQLSGERVKLIHFGARRIKGKGVSYAIERGGPRMKIIDPPTSAFIQTMPNSGHVGVFRRRSAARGSMFELRGPSLGNAFEGAPGMVEQVRWWAAGKLEKNIDDQVAFILNKWLSAGRASG